MYCTYYGFKEKPFQITPNPRFLYLSRNHREAFAHLLYGINAHGGFIELTGEVGTGKTTVLRTLLEQLDDSTHRTALILNPCLSATELLRSINREFGIPHEGMENGTLLNELNRFLLAENREGRTVVLVIDEAQNLAPQVLEQIRLISNLETETDKLIQIVLAGQPELKTLLGRSELRQLAQRITVSYHLLPMDYSDSVAYIQHRLQVAGTRRMVEFSPGALKRIFAFAKGAPRLLNLACDRALLVGYGEETRAIDGAIAATAIAELSDGKRHLPRQSRIVVAVALLLCLALSVMLAFLPTRQSGAGRNFNSPPADHGTGMAAKTGTSSPPRGTAQPLNWETLPKGPDPAVNAILRLWGRKDITAPLKARTAATLLNRRGLTTTGVTSLRDVVALDTPAILEIAAGKGGATRHIALTSTDGRTFTIAPGLPGAPAVSLGELAAVWTGRGQIAWRNDLNIPRNLQPGTEDEGVLKLQRLLARAGLFKGKQTGILDGATMGAVRSLQKNAGLTVDGIPSDRTLLVLYRDYGTKPLPRLSTTREPHR